MPICHGAAMDDLPVARLRMTEIHKLRADLAEADDLIAGLRDENDALKAEICELQHELSEWSDHG